MEKWFVTTLLLCAYGFFKELRPSEPFLTEYLIGPQWHNITSQDVYQQVYPVWTYAYLVLLFFVFLLTDLLRYKPVIVVEGIAYVGTWSLLIWARGVFAMQVMEFTYGIATSTEVAYYTYIYAKVPQEAYKAVTSYTRAAILAGRFGSGFFAQLLTSTGVMDYGTLNYFSLASVVLCLVLSMSLPAARTSVYFHRDDYQVAIGDKDLVEGGKESPTSVGGSPVERTLAARYKDAIKLLWSDAKFAYSRMDILKWSMWWACGTCGNFQVGNYIQPLWEEIAPNSENEIYNGGVEAITTLLGAVAAFSIAYVTFDWNVVGDLVLGLISIIDATTLIVMAITDNIWTAYVCYVIFRMSYQTMITIISYQVAKEIRPDSYGLIFGINTFFALLFQTILTVIVVEPFSLGLPARDQFLVYGGYFGFLGIVFLSFAFYLFFRKCTGREPVNKSSSMVSMAQTGMYNKRGSWEAKDDVPREEPPVGSTEAY